MDKIVEKIINLVNSKGIEQKVFAEAIGIKSNVISDWKSGRTKSYTKYLDKIADYLEVSVDTLVNPFDTNNFENFDNLSKDDKEFLLTWIKNNIIPSSHYYEKVDSYGLKHEIPTYFNNGAFKGAMLKSGYTPLDKSKTNWIFKISSFSPALLKRYHYDNISFYQNVLQVCKQQNLDEKIILKDIEDLGINACIINAIMLFADHLDVSVDFLLGRTDEPKGTSMKTGNNKGDNNNSSININSQPQPPKYDDTTTQVAQMFSKLDIVDKTKVLSLMVELSEKKGA